MNVFGSVGEGFGRMISDELVRVTVGAIISFEGVALLTVEVRGAGDRS